VKTIPEPQFTEFIEFFPELLPPVSLLPDLQQIPLEPVPLPAILLEAYILPIEAGETDEFTEYIPYGRIADTSGFHALVYWKAGVLRYEFILATYNAAGKPISHAIVGGMRYEDEGAIYSVAVIHPDLRITIAEGMSTMDDDMPQYEETQTYQMAILQSGELVYEVNEEKKEV
jgi:hypothetical protein